MKTKQIVAGILSAALAVGCFGACGQKEVNEDDSSTLTYWMPIYASAATTAAKYDETPFAQEWMKRTNTKLKFIHPSQGQESEKFSIMIASEELPDIIEYTWGSSYPGGPEKAISDGYIINLNDKLEQNSPAFAKYLKENPDMDKLTMTDSGAHFAYPGIMGDKSLATSAGLVLRKDWLDELSLKVPETIDEWETVLTAFRDQKNAKAPISFPISYFSWNMFVGAYGVAYGMYVEDDVIKFGPLEPGYKEFLIKMNDWFGKKLLDQNIASVDASTTDSNILNGISGATAGAVGGGIGKWMAAAPDENYDLVAAPYPVLNKGEHPQFGNISSRVNYLCIAISKDCKDVDKAMKFLDYGYTDEGRMLFNFGIEGESYEMKDGYPTYTDNVVKNSEGLSMQAMLGRYTRAANAAIGSIQDPRYMEQYAALPQQKEAVKIWSDTDAEKYLIPPVYPSQEESSEFAKLVTAVDSYNTEMTTKFIMGMEPFSNYDAYVEQLKTRGIERVIEIHQQAYNRYLAR